MNIVADESIESQIADYLRAQGHTVTSIEGGNAGAAILLTANREFAEHVFHDRAFPAGIVLLNLPGVDPDRKGRLVASALESHVENLRDSFAVLTERVFRIRSPLPSA